ncbi:MAG: cyclic-di-AMP receptor [Anaerolineae bacterium]|nr:MAG: cyclic-di-AMP receptor [Anaerolineae bacterium]
MHHAKVAAAARYRRHHVEALPPIMEPGELYLPTPVEVAVGGATVFVLNVERFEKY